MSNIKVLDRETIGKIAAGEVIERPAGVLKELLENAVDSGASVINIDIEKAGKGLIRVQDNGSGMQPEELKLSVQRHATSKISQFEDLDTLHTFGFRGEALFSIAAVSKLSISSSAGEEGGKISSSGGDEPVFSPAPAVKGTTVEVRDLFFNVPARLKFMKSDAYERAMLLRVIEESALANLDINYNVKTDGRQIYRLTADPAKSFEEKVRMRAKEILGPNVAASMQYYTDDKYSFRIFITPPEHLVALRDLQFSYVNRRPVTSKTVQQAVYKAYQGTRGRDKHPAFIIYMDMPPADFDINIHPQKREIRFVKESSMFVFLVSLLTDKFFKTSRAEGSPQDTHTDILSAPAAVYRPELPPFQNALPGSGTDARVFDTPAFAQHKTVIVKDFEEKIPYTVSPSAEDSRPAENAPADPFWWRGPYRYIGALHKSFLIYENADGLILLDQHAARERVLYEKFLEDYERNTLGKQPLIFPVEVELPSSNVENVMLWKEWLGRAGFDIEKYSARSLMVNAVPNILRFKEDDLKDFIITLSQVLDEPSKSTDDLKKKMIAMLACKKSIKAKEQLSYEEADAVLNDLKKCDDGLHCPHGRPVFIEISAYDIAKKLGR
ncbi:DNA mismatch repair protein MutL [Parelusimicrobium proximum]|uniref:DNA mismatch repair endonuclease MutL n=1 Tax=Parelusimicrobium proximum TaxID=3228953 RepID=UPI003D165B9C